MKMIHAAKRIINHKFMNDKIIQAQGPLTSFLCVRVFLTGTRKAENG